MTGHPTDKPDALVEVVLSDAERRLLRAGLSEWGGPGHMTDALAVAMGFNGRSGFEDERQRLDRAIETASPLSRRDWTRVVVATEIVFVSDAFGAGFEWTTVTGLTDAETLETLRPLQYRLMRSGAILRPVPSSP